jgi:hypothetical protein
MIALKKKPKSTKCKDHRTYSKDSRENTIEKKIEDVHGEDQFGFRRGKGSRDAIGLRRIIPKRTLDIYMKKCACFVDCQNAFDHINWTKLMQILKGADINWRERRLINKLYMCQSDKVGTTLPRKTKL